MGCGSGWMVGRRRGRGRGARVLGAGGFEEDEVVVGVGGTEDFVVAVGVRLRGVALARG